MSKNLPINLPMRVVSGQPVSAVWANSIREAIARLANRGEEKKRGGGVGSVSRGAFYTIYTVSSGDATNGDIMLTGGQVTAGTGTETVPAYVLYDASGSAWAGTAGQHLQLAINGEGEEVDDVLMPVFNQDTSGSVVTVVSTIADNILPEVGLLSGLCNVSLGVFTGAGFTPSLIGNIQVSFCYGGFTVSRF